MEQRDREQTTNRILLIVTAVLFSVLVFLVCALIHVFQAGSDGTGQFDIDMIISGGSDSVDMSTLLVPEFIGITSDGKRAGILFSEMISYDIAKSLAPTIAYVIDPENAVESGQAEWEKAADGSFSVFIRYHSEMPDAIVGMFSDILAGNERVRSVITSNIFEMIVVPYSEQNGVMQIYTRSSDGKVMCYSAKDPRVFVTAGEMATLMKSYSSSLMRFTFAGDSFESLSPTEPLLIETVQTKNVLVSDKTAPILLNTPGDSTALLEVFGMNPDKVTLTHSDDEGASSYVGSYGVLYIHDSSFEYKAASDGGIKLRDITGFLPSESIGIEEYISAAAVLHRKIRNIDRIYAGGEASVYLSSISSEKGRVTVELRYEYDNIPIAEADPAIRAVFVDGVLKEAEVYTLSVRPEKDRSIMMAEWGFASHLEKRGIKAHNISLVYRMDYGSESVKTEWCAETYD